MLRPHWRHFVPRVRRYVQKHPQSSLFGQAQAIVDERVARLNLRRAGIEQLDSVIESLKRSVDTRRDVTLLARLVLQAPRAARAQQQMDKHPHGYHDRTQRLYELIDFNDTYVDTVLSLSEEELVTFNDYTKRAADTFCKRIGARSFSNEQWEAITHGLSREVAVYRGAMKEGLKVRMTSRLEDAKGIDMVITDPTDNKTMNVDIKTGSAFHFRVIDLEREGRITADQQAHAEQYGYCPVVNGHGREAVEVVLLRIDNEALGTIINFSFENSTLLGKELRKILAEVGYPSQQGLH